MHEMAERQQRKLSEITRWLWRASAGARAMIALSTLIGIVDVALGLLFVWICKQTIDVATGVEPGNLTTYGIGMCAVMLVEIGVRALSSWIANTMGVRNRNRLRMSLFSRLMREEWQGLESHHSGDVLNRLINDINTVSSLITDISTTLIITVAQLIASFIFLFSMDSMLAIILVVIMPVFLLFSRFYMKHMRGMTKDVRESDSLIHATMQESLQNKMVIKTLEQDQEVLSKLDGLQDTLEKQVLRRTRFSIGSRTFVSIGFSAGYLTAFLWGAFRISAGAITFGVMTAFLQLVGRVQRPITDLARMIPNIVSAITSSERLMELEEKPLEENGEKSPTQGTAGVRLQNVTFRYSDGNKHILENFSADFPPHSTTAILGETGAGKTTLIRLLLALVRPDNGKVTVYDNEGSSFIASPSTRCNFVYVPQGNTLFSGSIRDNLLLGRANASEEEMWEVLSLACADFVRELPEGLDTLCGERGGGLSEGQAQRIAIARSLLRPGSILLLDEATSALDTDTEQQLLQRITSAKKGKTIIFITHRASITDYCSSVLRIETPV
ncbi:MAG: ABC transporter ATP-binding protein [Bacteroidaceae bacterium]|nr:ABC transporter ATP-binding protein [Bacteroidaceae bacterium]